MPAPVLYDAPQEHIASLKLDTFGSNITPPPSFIDPVRTFETTTSDVDGSIRQWTTMDIPTRKKLVLSYASARPRDDGHGTITESAVEREQRVRNRWRTLNYIIQEESRFDKTGSREIAALAFSFLFPQAETK